MSTSTTLPRKAAACKNFFGDPALAKPVGPRNPARVKHKDKHVGELRDDGIAAGTQAQAEG